jgi:hypothetical protein
MTTEQRAKRLDDLNTDCVQSILKYLPAANLVRVADTCKDLRETAHTVPLVVTDEAVEDAIQRNDPRALEALWLEASPDEADELFDHLNPGEGTTQNPLVDIAVAAKAIDALQWLMENVLPDDGAEAVKVAMRKDDVEMLDMLWHALSEAGRFRKWGTFPHYITGIFCGRWIQVGEHHRNWTRASDFRSHAAVRMS